MDNQQPQQDQNVQELTVIPIYQTKEGILYALEFEAYGNIMVACHKVGIARQTYYDWANKDTQFELDAKEASRKGKQHLRDLAESALAVSIAAGNITAIIFTLKNLDKEHYGEGVDNGTVTNNNLIFTDPRAITSLLAIADKVKENLAKEKAKEEAQSADIPNT